MQLLRGIGGRRGRGAQGLCIVQLFGGKSLYMLKEIWFPIDATESVPELDEIIVQMFV